VYTNVWWPGLLLTVSLLAAPARGQIDLTTTPAMTKGPAEAPVTIVEFSDYQ
jgi:hypothetical protein